MELESLRFQFGALWAWEKRGDGWWLNDPDLYISEMAERMVEAGARLVTITARPAQNGECQLIYHWDMDSQLVHLRVITRDLQAVSIAPICPAADWVEREIHDYYGVKFSGREDLAPLVLRPGDLPDVFPWKESHPGGRQ